MTLKTLIRSIVTFKILFVLDYSSRLVWLAHLDGEVVDDGDAHVGVGLQAEGEDGGADEEHGDDPYTLGAHRAQHGQHDQPWPCLYTGTFPLE